MTAVETRVIHDWRLVAPWWHWPRVGAGTTDEVRTSAPVFQKYDRPDAVNALLADPQLRLQFDPASDETWNVKPAASPFNVPTLERTHRRKIYLGSHHRQYLVLASLHCDAPRFPHVNRTDVCEAGFVVRRRTLSVPQEVKGEARKVLKEFAAARRRRAGAAAQVAAARLAGTSSARRVAPLQARLDSLAQIEARAAQTVQDWASAAGVQSGLEGWRPVGVSANGQTFPTISVCTDDRTPSDPAPLAGVGRWEPVVELPDELEEVSFPLYPLIADPALPDHDAQGETIYFGVVPTGSSDVDPTGAARLDDQATYEVRCFVRRHRPECPMDSSHCRCPITWSEPTEPYQLASHFDLQGTANRPVTVQLPDLKQLQADALRLGPGGTGGVRLQAPPGSAMPFSAEDVKATKKSTTNSSIQICSFSIPLITIVATFLFQLVLPIVMFIFQLWFLLLLKFCIPPEVDVDVDLKAALDLLPPTVALGLDADVEVLTEAKAAAFEVAHQSQLDAALANAAAGSTHRVNETTVQTFSGEVGKLVAGGQLDKLGRLALIRGTVATEAKPPPDRVFAPRVERDEVVAR